MKYTWDTTSKKNPPEYILAEWVYNIAANSNIQEIITAFETPIQPDSKNVTFLEGWNIFDYDEYLTNIWFIEAWEFIAYCENPEKIQALSVFFPQFLSPDLKSLEWFLYPDTYTIDTANFGINKLVIKMLENFETKIGSFITNEDIQDIHNLTILASIVEKEERNPSEKSTVAGILKKRLDAWWMIGADITVCYPHRLTSEECKLSVTKYLYEENDYNTRQKRGLPAWPIWNPSLETLKATISHKKTPYWFYLHDTVTGKIYYAKTNEEHSINKSRYLK